MAQRTYHHPTHIYRTQISILLYLLLFGATIGIFTIAIFNTQVLLAKIFCGVAIACTLWQAVLILHHWNDRIIVTPLHLSISHVSKKTRDGEWTDVNKAIIRWSDIKDIIPQFDFHTTNHVLMQKDVILVLRNGLHYRIDSDLYDVLFLGRKLQSHLHHFTSQQ